VNWIELLVHVELKDKTMRLSRRFTLMVAIIALILYSTQTGRSDEVVAVPDEPIQIIPAAKLPATISVPAPIVSEGGAPAGVVDSAEYRRVYRSIPFSRAEYNVNPNYRHDTTLEILTGTPHHQTIVQHNYEHKEPVHRIPPPSYPSRVLTPFAGFGNLWGAPLWNFPLRYW